ncbi:MAG: DUF1641 domain-containing protein [Planctomycetales bacterium]|nr:DUF1641 domain-containing protein [Planctomycetales bacterium]
MTATAAEISSSRQQLLERLNDPAVTAGIGRLLDKLDLVAFGLDAVDGFLHRSEVIVDSVGESLQEFKAAHPELTAEALTQGPRMAHTGVRAANAAAEADFDELAASQIVRRLTRRETLATLNGLLDKLPLIVFGVDAIEDLLRRSETIADNVSGAVDELHLREKGGGLDKLLKFIAALPRVTEAGEKLLDSGLMDDGLHKVVDAGVTMVESGMLDEEVVAILGDLGKKFAETYRDVASSPAPPVGGLFGTLRAAKDPDVQKSLGFAFAMAKAFARHLK